MTTVVRAIFYENNKYYQQDSLDECKREKYKREKWKVKIKENDIKNHMCYYFHDIIKSIDIDFNDFLLDEKFYKENYGISYKTSTGANPFRIRYNEIDGFIRIQDRIKYFKGRNFSKKNFREAKTLQCFGNKLSQTILLEIFREN